MTFMQCYPFYTTPQYDGLFPQPRRGLTKKHKISEFNPFGVYDFRLLFTPNCYSGLFKFNPFGILSVKTDALAI